MKMINDKNTWTNTNTNTTSGAPSFAELAETMKKLGPPMPKMAFIISPRELEVLKEVIDPSPVEPVSIFMYGTPVYAEERGRATVERAKDLIRLGYHVMTTDKDARTAIVEWLRLSAFKHFPIKPGSA